jgi:hypothetical protein
MDTGPIGVPIGESPGGDPAPHLLAPPGAGFAAPAAGPVDEPPPPGVSAPVPSGRLSAGFWPVACLLVADDGGARLRIPVTAGSSVHAIVAATVRLRTAPIVEIEALDGRRFRYAPVADIRVAAGEVLKAGAVLGTVAGDHAAHLELAVRDPDGRWVDPYPLLVGLADPNELGVDNRTGDGIDPDVTRRTAPAANPSPAAVVAAAPTLVSGSGADGATVVAVAEVAAPPSASVPAAAFAGFPAPAAPLAAFPPPTGPPVAPATDESASEPPAAEPQAAEPPAAEKPTPSRITSDILAAMIAPTPAPQPERTDD